MSLFKNSLKLYSKNIAVIDDNGISISYKDLESFSDFISENIPKRSIIISLNKNTLGSIIGYYSFIRNNIVSFMIDQKTETSLIQNLLNIYNPEFLWIPNDNVKDFSNYSIICKIYDYSLLRKKIDYEIKIHPDLALCLSTSGTTGSSKFVRLSYKNILYNAKSIIKYLNIDHKERPITTLPMNYSFGLSIINSHFESGATILLTNYSLFQKEFWNFFKKNNATSISGVPYTFEMLKKLRLTKMDLPSLNTLTQAGGKMHIDLIKEFAEYCNQNKKRLFIMYGQTEATARMSYLDSKFSLIKAGSIGKPIPGGKFSIVNESNEIINENDTVGELVYQGSNVSMGYSESPEDLSKNDINNEKLYTGDLAKRDQDGFYYIVGRKKRFLKIFGNRINLDGLEQLLKDITHNCACVGKDDYLVIYITEKHKIDVVKDFIKSKILLHHSAFDIRFIDTIPKNLSGKINYSELKII